MRRPLSPEEQYTQAARVRELVDLLRAFLEGRTDRVDIARWTCTGWREAAAAKGGFPDHAIARLVFMSLEDIERRWGDDFLVRREDVTGYVEWLTTRGYLMASLPLAAVARSIDSLVTEMRGDTVRFFLPGLGWLVETCFASAATGRGFWAVSDLERGSGLEIRTIRGDDPTEAAQDLAEALALDTPEVQWIEPRIDLAALPRWSLWRQDDNGQRYEMSTFLSYSRAMRECATFEARGHKQMYWVRRQGQGD
ncbi:hypothetical protein [Polyangium jinanense]|uniref:Uncharacterized protein n=1 Tax=Polyangium jinanense TaxID=2829994 RepID=A0A9X3XFX2_9BACT|nr:hypothetical protein [Polyangium jinanense]MDC3961934.1 hypothetical protein [Polyangium jinanense]MDC3988665.1 hypothetical protein [Polyangium jinanense]